MKNCPALLEWNLSSPCNCRVNLLSRSDRFKFHPGGPGSCNHHHSGFRLIFFLSRFSFTDIDVSWDREGTIFYSTLPLPPAHEHSDIYLQLCMWADYHVCVYQTATRWDLQNLIELPFDWLTDDVLFVCLLDGLIRDICYSNLTWEIGGFELASTIILVLQANRLTKCASHPKWRYF